MIKYEAAKTPKTPKTPPTRRTTNYEEAKIPITTPRSRFGLHRSGGRYARYNKVPISPYLKFARNGNAHTNACKLCSFISWTGNKTPKNPKNRFLPLEFCSLYRAISRNHVVPWISPSLLSIREYTWIYGSSRTCGYILTGCMGTVLGS